MTKTKLFLILAILLLFSPTSNAASPITCTVAASNLAPTVGTTITLSARCNKNPTSYVWTGCASTTSVCSTTSQTAGSLTYMVSASNASSTGVASVNVNWQGAPQPGMPTSADFINKTGDPRAQQPYGSAAGYSAMKRMANGDMIVFGMSHTFNENNAVETYNPVADSWTVRIPHTPVPFTDTASEAGLTYLLNRDNQVNMMLRPLNEYWVMMGYGGGSNGTGNYRGVVDTTTWKWKDIDDTGTWAPTGTPEPQFVWDGVGEWIDGLNLGAIYGGTQGNPGDKLYLFIPKAGTPRFTIKAYLPDQGGNPSFTGSEMLRYMSQSNWVRGNYLYIYGGVHRTHQTLIDTLSQTIYKLDVTNPNLPVMSVQSVNTLAVGQAVKGDAVLADYDAVHDLAVITDGVLVNVYNFTTNTWANVLVNTPADPARLSPDASGTGGQARWSPGIKQMIILSAYNGRTFGLRLNY